MRGTRLTALIAMAILVDFGCRDAPFQPDATEQSAARGEPVDSLAGQAAEGERPPAPGTLSGILGGGDSFTGAGPIAIGSYDEPTLVDITVSGLLDVYYNYPDELRGQYAGQLDAAGDWVAWLNSCKGRTNVYFVGGGGFGICDYGDLLPPQETWTQRSTVLGLGSMERRPGPTNTALRCDYTGWPPCFTLTGWMTATVTPTADVLQLEADKDGVMPGELVSFTASTANEEPFEIREWIWVANFAGAENAPDPGTVPCSNEISECVTAVMETGTMYVRALVAGVIQQAEAPVSVEPDDLLLTADKPAVWPGETVTFTSSTAKGWPYDISRWTWQPDDGELDPSEPCAPHVKVCATAIGESGTMTAEGWVAGEFRTASASVTVLVCGEGDIVVAQAAGPNPNGSFLGGQYETGPPENIIELRAGFENDCSQLEVHWEVEDEAEDAVPSPPVATPEPGLESRFEVPLPVDREWFTTDEPNVELTALAYQVRAYVEPPSGRVYSDPVTVRQDSVDVIRQEYLEVLKNHTEPSDRFPAYSEFRDRPIFDMDDGAQPLWGDHCPLGGPPCRVLAAPRLITFADWLIGAWTFGRLRLSGAYRNPVHHHIHLGHWENDSPHKYGTAVDLGTTNESLRLCFVEDWRSPPDCYEGQGVYWAVLRNLGLSYPLQSEAIPVWAEPARLIPNLNHVHFDLRDPEQPRESDDWRERTWPPPPEPGAGAAAPDALIAALRSPDWRWRAAAVSVLGRVPPTQLPADGVSEIIALLERESDWATQVQETRTAEEEHAYGEYLIELVALTLSTREQAAVPALAKMGIDVSQPVRKFVVQHLDVALPALEDTWRDRWYLRADVVATLGELLADERRGALQVTQDERARVYNLLLDAASDELPTSRWAVVQIAAQHGLVEWTPVVARLAQAGPDPDDPLDIVGSTARQHLPELERVRSRQPRRERLRRLQQLQSAFCVNSTGERGRYCETLVARLGAIGRVLERPDETAAEIGEYRDLLTAGATQGSFRELERLLLTENAENLRRQ